MNVLFLDFDGVINNTTSREVITLPMKMKDGHICVATYWMAECISPFLKLMRWCKNNEIKIVISSTWRLNQNADVFNEYFGTYFRREGKIPDVVGITPRHYDMHRGREIQQYINENNVDNYIIIDDDIDDIVDTLPDERVVKINAMTGIVEKDVDKIAYMWYHIINGGKNETR